MPGDPGSRTGTSVSSLMPWQSWMDVGGPRATAWPELYVDVDIDSEEGQRLRKLVRHDLRSPLAVILGRCEILEAGVQGSLNDAQQHSVAAIKRQADRLEEMLAELAELLE